MRKLIEKLAQAEQNLVQTKFLAPRLRGSQVRVRVDGLLKMYTPTPTDFEGWGVFQTEGHFEAVLARTAGKVEVTRYLEALKSTRLILVRPLRDQTWLAYPAHVEVFEKQFESAGPVVVHLVTLGRAFETVLARHDGANFWFDRRDKRCDPRLAKRLAEGLKSFVAPQALRIGGLTPELRSAYALVFQAHESHRVSCSEERLKRALAVGGGRLESFVDRGEFWNTTWTTGTGETHTSAIRKSDFTVLSSGICLDGEDGKFDLQSLVGVIEQRY